MALVVTARSTIEAQPDLGASTLPTRTRLTRAQLGLRWLALGGAAWYGLGLVALLDHDGSRAREVFGRLTTGEHAATQDPMVLAWSHVYLARVLDEEGKLEQSKSEYQAALAVQGAPAKAQQAAQKELGDLNLRKSAERP